MLAYVRPTHTVLLLLCGNIVVSSSICGPFAFLSFFHSLPSIATLPLLHVFALQSSFSRINLFKQTPISHIYKHTVNVSSPPSLKNLPFWGTRENFTNSLEIILIDFSCSLFKSFCVYAWLFNQKSSSPHSHPAESAENGKI